MYCFYAIPAIMWLVFCFLLFSSFNPTMISHLCSQDWWETWWPVGLTPSGCWCFGSCNACHNNTWFVANLSGTYCSASRDEAVSTTRTPMVSRTHQSNLKVWTWRIQEVSTQLRKHAMYLFPLKLSSKLWLYSIRSLLYLLFPGHLTRMWVVSLLDVVGLSVCTSSSRLIFGWFEETSREFLLSSYHFQRTQVVFNNNRNGLYF